MVDCRAVQKSQIGYHRFRFDTRIFSDERYDRLEAARISMILRWLNRHDDVRI